MVRRIDAPSLGSVVGLVFLIVIEGDAVLLRKRGVLVILCRLTVIVASKSQIECAGTSLFELSRFFEAAMTTLLHGRAPEPRELTLDSILTGEGPGDTANQGVQGTRTAAF